ncbi:hypothetical protein GOBAR_AA28370 [Gossypium barbadense]|uniref:Selenium-binding protein n=1 Tax=Gossypium barbadense TaxID=3634 RepID=A0A2P5WMK2_GOSBA|nr:hypothetical protein GOBAR_AA28370 [Gossypium barbadense]
MSGPKEALLYVTCVYNGFYNGFVCIHAGTGREKPDFWQRLISCHGDPSADRRFLVLPSFLSSRVYVIDTQKNPKAPSLYKVVQPEDIIKKTGLAHLHTSHCLASGDIMISCLGDKDGNAEGSGFLLLDSEFNIKGRWEKPGHSPIFGYDFWYQPRHKTMISSSFGAPTAFTQGFHLQHVAEGLYGRYLHVYSWPDGELKQTLDLGGTGFMPLEIRFLHDPSKDTGYVRFNLVETIGRYQKIGYLENCLDYNWDILISRRSIGFCILPNWLHGDIRHIHRGPKIRVLVAKYWVGGLIQQGKPLAAMDRRMGQSIKRGTADDPIKLRRHNGPTVLIQETCGERFPHMFADDIALRQGGLLKFKPTFFCRILEHEPDGPCLAHEIEISRWIVVQIIGILKGIEGKPVSATKEQ